MKKIKIYKEYYNNGKLRTQCYYNNSKAEKEKTKGIDIDTQNGHSVIMFSNITRVKLDGEYKLWHENGQLWNKYFYRNGIIHGKYEIIKPTRNKRKKNKLLLFHYKNGIFFGQSSTLPVSKKYSIS